MTSRKRREKLNRATNIMNTNYKIDFCNVSTVSGTNTLPIPDAITTDATLRTYASRCLYYGGVWRVTSELDTTTTGITGIFMHMKFQSHLTDNAPLSSFVSIDNDYFFPSG